MKEETAKLERKMSVRERGDTKRRPEAGNILEIENVKLNMKRSR